MTAGLWPSSGEGLANRQIGQRTFLAEQAVQNYVSALLQKLAMERRTQAAAVAARLSGRGARAT